MSIPISYATDTSHVKRSVATDMPALSVLNYRMTHNASAVLAENLKRIIEQAGISTRAWALSKKLEPRNIHRIIAGTQSPTLDLLSEIGAAVDMDSWQLLVPGLDPSNPPVVTMTKAERDFYRKVREEFRTLPSL